ncbi:MAG: CapA family protein [Clostridia bacterium]|nr:CapA family protein [Clostridia bacterium]
MDKTSGYVVLRPTGITNEKELIYMRRSSRRSRSGWFRLPAKSRLIISIMVLAVIILSVALLIRGLTAVPDVQTPSDAPSVEDMTLVDDASALDGGLTDNYADSPVEQSDIPADAGSDDDETLSEDEGDTGEDALENVADEEVDLEGDLSAGQQTVAVGGRSAVIRSIGDIVGHVPILKSVYDSKSKSYDFTPIFSQIKDSMANADYTVINVDGPLGGKKFASYRGYPQFNTPPQLLLALKDAGVDMLTLANNHALDTYFDGLVGTIKNVERAELDHVGAYASQQDYDTPKVVNINGINVGFVNYTTTTNGMAKKSDPAATQYGLRMTSNSDANKDIQALKSAGAEFVVVYMHWGEEYTRSITNQIKNLATTLVAAGADVIVGGHQHVVLPCRWVTATDSDGNERRGLVAYGLGNFLSDQRARYRDSGIIFEFTIGDNEQTGAVEVVSAKYVPTYVHRTTGSDSYVYRVLACGEIIADRPSGISDDVFKRIKQVWNEQKELMGDGPASIARS